jgi:hypothetical protein
MLSSFLLTLADCRKTLRSPFDKLRANGVGIAIVVFFVRAEPVEAPGQTSQRY